MIGGIVEGLAPLPEWKKICLRVKRTAKWKGVEKTAQALSLEDVRHCLRYATENKDVELLPVVAGAPPGHLARLCLDRDLAPEELEGTTELMIRLEPKNNLVKSLETRCSLKGLHRHPKPQRL